MLSIPSLRPREKIRTSDPQPKFHQLQHAVAYWDRILCRTPTSATHDADVESKVERPKRRRAYLVPKLSRRVTVPSVQSLEYETHQVVTLDPQYTSHTDLDDISQPENGVVADAEISASDSESEASAKEDETKQIVETPYVSNESEVFGLVSHYFKKKNILM